MRDSHSYNIGKNKVILGGIPEIQEYPDRTVREDITTIQQLVDSYYAAKAIVRLRVEREQLVLEAKKALLPTLNIDKYKNKENKERAIALYSRFCKLVEYNSFLVLITKLAIEDMFEFGFSESPSVMVKAMGDNEHLSRKYSSSYSLLSKVNLFTHTMNVFEEAIKIGESKGRVLQVSLSIVSALLHDFGKGKNIRMTLLGNEVGKGFKPHSEVSVEYIREILYQHLLRFLPDLEPSALSKIEYIVGNHHPSSNREKSDGSIMLVTEADYAARDKEMSLLRKEEAQKKQSATKRS